MPKKQVKDFSEYIVPLYMNGLSGRMLRLPPPANKKREILFIFGHHTSLERIFGVVEYLNRYGGVTVPDLPGFGGMKPFYKIGQKPTLDNMADYLAAFVRLRYRNRRLTLMGMSYGFAVVTRMLQKYPDIVKKVDLLVSLVGLAHYDDFKFKRRNLFILRWTASILSTRLPAAIVQHLALRGIFIRATYRLVEHKHEKLVDADAQERRHRIAFEVVLWRCNDFRTYSEAALSMFRLDLTKKHVDLPVYHIGIENDRYFDNTRVEQHMRSIYTDFHFFNTKLPAHAPTVIATAKEAAPYIPPKIRTVLRRKV